MTELVPAVPSPARIFTVPNLLTLLRLLMVPFFVSASIHGRFTTAFILFVTAALTDVVDGTIARLFNQRSRLGAMLDPAADKAIMISGYVVYTFHPAVSHRLPDWLTLVVFARDGLIILFAYLLYTRVRITRFPPSYAGKISTLVQAITLACVISVNSFLPGLQKMADALFLIALVATLCSGLDYLRRTSVMLEAGGAT
jgi:cardiolipin synthase (CMP-forming)